MDFVRLRGLLGSHILTLARRFSHIELPGVCAELGLPQPPLKDELTKRQRMEASLQALPQSEMMKVTQSILASYPPEPQLRKRIHGVLWADEASPRIPKRYRREVGLALEREDLCRDAKPFFELLDRLFVLDGPQDHLEVFVPSSRSLRTEIEQHVFRFPEDWAFEQLFEALGAYDCSDYQFCLLLEGLACSDVRPDETAQRRFVDLANTPLKRCAVELRETENDGGYPVFKIVSLCRGVAGTPKNLVFASPWKPDIRFRDAVNNDIEIVTNADKVLVYDRPIGTEGLRWSDLQAWWTAHEAIVDEEEAKRTLYRRLKKSLPKESPPQQRLFKAFHEGFNAAIPNLPALLPEVWLHWDPKTVEERGPQALLSYRMDFLLLLPANVRVVVEVDGKQHYADEKGRADVRRYAKTMAADRELRLAGYEVYRFGAGELSAQAAPSRTKAFFEALFKRHRVSF